MFSRGMLAAFASAMIVRRRGFMFGSPPPLRAATLSSLMIRVNSLPRLASAAPFLCLIVCHLEWPDMYETPEKTVVNSIARRQKGRERQEGQEGGMSVSVTFLPFPPFLPFLPFPSF